MKNNNTNPPTDPKSQWETIARYSGLGMEMAIAVLGAAFIGQYLDRRFGLEQPICTLALSFFGVIYVFYRIFRVSSK